MNEFIEKLIGRLEEKQDEYFHGKSDYEEGKYNAYDEVVQIVNQLAEEYSNLSENLTGWIPCSEELPSQPKSNLLFENKPLELYLATVKGSDYAWRVFWNGECFTDGWSKVDVLAWQPLPDPYIPNKE